MVFLIDTAGRVEFLWGIGDILLSAADIVDTGGDDVEKSGGNSGFSSDPKL